MSYKITQNTDGTWALVNQITGTTVLSADSADAISIASAGLLGMSRGTLAATGSGASTAAVITKQVTAVTASDGTKAVALPAAATTTGPLMVINTVTTATLPVYPVNGGNDNINSGAEDAAWTLGPGQAAWFIPTSATQWYVMPASSLTSTTAELQYLDITTLGTGAASKAVVLDANGDYIWPATGQLIFKTATNALIHGAGASGANHGLGSTAGNAMEYYLDGTHTSGDMRGQYLRLYFSGAGGSGEAARIFGTINNVSVATGGTVNGAHISLGTAGASAAVSGAANALRATFGIAAASTNIGGTCSVIQVDTDFDTAVTVPTNFAFLRLTNSNTKKSNNFLRLPNVTGETAGLFCAHTTQGLTHSIRIVSEDGTPYYIMCTDANTNRTES
jgi:hypothetical protein